MRVVVPRFCDTLSVFQSEETASRAAHGRVSHFFPVSLWRGHPHTIVARIERRSVHLSACKCVHRWSITDRDAAELLDVHRTPYILLFGLLWNDRVANREKRNRGAKEEGTDDERKYFSCSFFKRTKICSVSRCWRTHISRYGHSIQMKTILSKAKRLRMKSALRFARYKYKRSRVSTRLNDFIGSFDCTGATQSPVFTGRTPFIWTGRPINSLYNWRTCAE